MRSEVFAAIRKLGTELAPPLLEGTQKLYAPLVARPDPQLCTVERDLVYGPDARHRLDIFHPAKAATRPVPVVAFVHGGGFVRGDKGGADAPFYNNVGVWAVQQEMIGVTLTYRLAPGSQWPSGADDVAAAVDWLNSNVSRFGGDPDRIFLMGQSAGAAHVAGHLAGHHGRGPVRNLAGAVMLSGIYDLLSLRHSPFEEAYFGADSARFAAASSLDGLANTDVPCLFTVSELDPASFQQQALRLLNARWAAQGALPRLLYMQGHNHLSPILQLGSPVDTLGGDLLDFIRAPSVRHSTGGDS